MNEKTNNTEITTTSTVSTKSQDLATKLEAMMGEGKSLAEALDELKVKAPGAARPKIEDRVSYIKGLTSIPTIRKASKAAYAKKSKATTDEADLKYGEEIAAARERLDELNKIIAESENPLQKALEFDETPEGIVQRALSLFDYLDEELQTKLKKIGLTRKQAKDLMAAYPADTIPQKVTDLFTQLGDPEPYLKIWTSRSQRKDQRVININRTIALLENIQEGEVKGKKNDLGPAPKKKGSKASTKKGSGK